MTLTNAQVRDRENVLHPFAPIHMKERGALILERGKGIYVYDNRGRPYIEAMSGLWCSGLGFGDEELIEAGVEQLRRLPSYHIFGHRSHEPAIALAEKLKEIAPVPMARAFFCCSGSEANDTQVKLAWYYNNGRGKPEKKKIISRMKGYHGMTVMAASLTGIPLNQREWDVPVARVLHTDCPHFYRFGEADETEAEFTARLARNLREMIEREGPETIAAMIAEPVMGAGGVVVAPEGYYQAIAPILEEHDILLIADEVITGFGRTGNWWGSQTVGMTPQTISSAKQLTAAYAPLGAVLIPSFMNDVLEAQSSKIGMFAHGFTYGGHPLSCAMGLKTIEIYEKRDIVGHVRSVMPRFAERLRQFADSPLVGEVRVKGLLGALELVADKKTRQSFEPEKRVATRVADAAERHGLIVRALGDTVVLCPPMIIKEDEIDTVFDLLRKALDEIEAELGKPN